MSGAPAAFHARMIKPRTKTNALRNAWSRGILVHRQDNNFFKIMELDPVYHKTREGKQVE